MKSRHFLIFLFCFVLPLNLFAGSRGVALMFLDATSGERTKASLRLAELLEMDLRQLYVDPTLNELFRWNENNLELQVLDPKNVGISFDRLLNLKKNSDLSGVFKENAYPDGLIAIFHDQEGGFVRLKLYDSSGKELLLIRLPIDDENSAMPGSVIKSKRRGALIAIGAAVNWVP